MTSTLLEEPSQRAADAAADTAAALVVEVAAVEGAVAVSWAAADVRGSKESGMPHHHRTRPTIGRAVW